MSVYSLIRRLRRRFDSEQNSEFNDICQMAGLKLDLVDNRNELSTLRDIFVNRQYADFFPFYEKSIIVDVCAHFGYFTLFAAKNSAASSRLFAIEPVKENYGILCKNIEACNLSNITTLNSAVSDSEGVRDLFKGKSINHSLFSKQCNALSSNESEQVQSITLAHVIREYGLDRIDFLKLDCEGAEYPILFSLDSSTFAKIRTISMEFHDLKTPGLTGNALANHLEKLGFRVVRFTYLPTKMDLNYGRLVATKTK